MKNKLYPIKFRPILQERIWGGINLGYKNMNDYTIPINIGESWEVSGLSDNVSEVINGELAGNNLLELLEVYMGDVVGDYIYEKYGNLFPLLVKVIDTSDLLSIQVHPNDAIAEERHGSYGKSEMWYVVSCEEGSYIYLGFKDGITKEDYIEAVSVGSIETILNKVEVKSGDTYFVPAGAVHSLGKNITIIEVQQPSDVTYRIFDWNRVDDNGNGRELHTELAIDAIDFSYKAPEAIIAQSKVNEVNELVSSDYFNVSYSRIDGEIIINMRERDDFMIMIAVEGMMFMQSGDYMDAFEEGETVLLPNDMSELKVIGNGAVLLITPEKADKVRGDGVSV